MGLQFIFAVILSSISIYYYFNRKKSQQSIEKFKSVCDQFDYSNQSAEFQQNGATVRASTYTAKGGDNELNFLTCFFEECKTMNDVLPHGAKQSADGRCLGSINSTKTGVDWIDFSTVLTRTKHFADGLMKLGLQPKSTFGIYSVNTPEYTITEYACYRHSIVVVPIYETLGPNICAFIAKQATLTVIYCDTLVRVENILKNVKDFEFLKHIIVSNKHLDKNQNDINSPSFEKVKEKVESCGLTLSTIVDVENLGSLNPQPDHPPHHDDLAVICYTSGTTDAPKGVMLTHQNVIANFSAILTHLNDYRLNNTDTLISYLPLGHMFERICESGMLSVGGKIGYFNGDIRYLSDDMKLIQPTMFPCVPRVLNKIYGKVYENVSSSQIKSWLLAKAYQAKHDQLANKIFDNYTFWDYLVFNKIRSMLGGHVRLIPVGSAPINEKVLDFLRCALGCHILEGYGQTECVAACSVTQFGDFSAGHVGVPLASTAIKLIDVPEMSYFVKDGKGEVMVKGSIVFKGYYKDQKKTDEVLDADNWLHTGDIGRFTENGTLQVIDRKKDIFKLAQGEYIAPAKIEDVYAQSPYILQIFVYGDSYKSCLVAFVVPNFSLIQEVFTKQSKGSDIDFKDNDFLRQNKDIKKFILEELTSVGKMSKLKSFEQAKDIIIYPEGFTVEDGLLTPTLKNKRFALKQHFQEQIKELYQVLD